jgi:glucosamine--fructose-6-phosphate aminotransferase (isomerizing)
LKQSGTIERLAREFRAAREWLFVGCGSSYYASLAAAASWSALTGQKARAVVASDVLLYPEPILAGSDELAAVVISRSGRTSEAIQAAEFLNKEHKVPTLAVTCTRGQALEKAANHTLALLPADEQSMVMTRSVTSMVLGLQYLAAAIAGDGKFVEELLKLPTQAEGLPDSLHRRVREFVGSRRFADYVCLGQGPFYGIASESALKLTEMSVSYAQVFHTLEFRHGPKSIVSPETLLIFLLSETGFDAEAEVLREMKELGGTIVAVTNRADEQVRKNSDLLVELGLDVPELARLSAYLLPAQFAGLFTGLKKGYDPDSPRNLSRVVVLDDAVSLRD